MSLPLIAITQGDPTGIGPEIIVGAWGDERLHCGARCVVVGHPEILRRAAHLFDRPAEVVEIDDPRAAETIAGPSFPACASVRTTFLTRRPRKIDARGGQAAYDALLRAVELAQSSQIDAIVTAPLNKAALWAAGHHYPGHTELLAELCGVKDFAMMLYLGPGSISQSLDRPGRGPRHAAHGAARRVRATFHRRDRRQNAPARRRDAAVGRRATADRRLRAQSRTPAKTGCSATRSERSSRRPSSSARRADSTSPARCPTDTLMVRARDGEFDAVVAMYHDQGHIALKLLGMQRAVNITLGLPIVRTSVAHGTAFDIAWQGRADPSSLIEAVAVAAQLATARLKPQASSLYLTYRSVASTNCRPVARY